MYSSLTHFFENLLFPPYAYIVYVDFHISLASLHFTNPTLIVLLATFDLSYLHSLGTKDKSEDLPVDNPYYLEQAEQPEIPKPPPFYFGFSM